MKNDSESQISDRVMKISKKRPSAAQLRANTIDYIEYANKD